MKKLYKILVDGKSCHGGDMEWSLPKGSKPGKWMRTEGEIAICSSGIHLTVDAKQWLKHGCKAYLAEAKGIEEWDGDKCVCRAARLIKEVSLPKWWRNRERFIKTFSDVPFFKCDGQLKVKHVLFEDRAAARSAAMSAAGDAARAAAWDASGAAAWAAARSAAWSAAGAAAWDAARAAAWDAAGAADINARIKICEGQELKSEHRKYADDVWSIWCAGYGCLGKIDDTFYVYKRP